MSHRPTDLERAIAKLTSEIDTLTAARLVLQDLRDAKPKRTRKPKAIVASAPLPDYIRPIAGDPPR